MIDFTSSLYLGLRHDSGSVPGWAQLTTGVPAALAVAPAAGTLEQALAGLIGTEAATLAPSTLHAFWDLFTAMSALEIHVDAGTYPIGWWGAERAHCSGAAVQPFRHHDPAALRRAVVGRGSSRNSGSRRLVVLTDGFCPGCGRIAPIDRYLAIVAPVGGLVVVDDTQALGVLGTQAAGQPYGRGGGGITRWLQVSSPHLLVVASLAKGFGVPLATVAGSEAAVRRYVARSETRVHCSPPSNAHLHAALEALHSSAKRGDALRRRLAGLVSLLRAMLGALGVPLTPGMFPVQSIGADTGVDLEMVHLQLAELGVRTVLNRPRCRQGIALTFIVTAAHRETDLTQLGRALKVAMPVRSDIDRGTLMRVAAK